MDTSVPPPPPFFRVTVNVEAGGYPSGAGNYSYPPPGLSSFCPPYHPHVRPPFIFNGPPPRPPTFNTTPPYCPLPATPSESRNFHLYPPAPYSSNHFSYQPVSSSSTPLQTDPSTFCALTPALPWHPPSKPSTVTITELDPDDCESEQMCRPQTRASKRRGKQLPDSRMELPEKKEKSCRALAPSTKDSSCNDKPHLQQRPITRASQAAEAAACRKDRQPDVTVKGKSEPVTTSLNVDKNESSEDDERDDVGGWMDREYSSDNEGELEPPSEQKPQRLPRTRGNRAAVLAGEPPTRPSFPKKMGQPASCPSNAHKDDAVIDEEDSHSQPRPKTRATHSSRTTEPVAGPSRQPTASHPKKATEPVAGPSRQPAASHPKRATEPVAGPSRQLAASHPKRATEPVAGPSRQSAASHPKRATEPVAGPSRRPPGLVKKNPSFSQPNDDNDESSEEGNPSSLLGCWVDGEDSEEDSDFLDSPPPMTLPKRSKSLSLKKVAEGSDAFNTKSKALLKWLQDDDVSLQDDDEEESEENAKKKSAKGKKKEPEFQSDNKSNVITLSSESDEETLVMQILIPCLSAEFWCGVKILINFYLRSVCSHVMLFEIMSRSLIGINLFQTPSVGAKSADTQSAEEDNERDHCVICMDDFTPDSYVGVIHDCGCARACYHCTLGHYETSFICMWCRGDITYISSQRYDSVF
ncbi:Putative cyclin-F3-2 [Frankliniella fusca]|uniref:Cyclin-F3-2 n=1 Tax=Frankliniella fusca TaxID=407009 RepID=A0AAE1LTD9_9NEOP|nr:Putative cyclin-F3-2 [Frankliniella fusca]